MSVFASTSSSHSFLVDCAGTASLQGAWQTLQENAEQVCVRVMAGQSSSFLSQARGANWLPDLPPKATAGPSTYITEVVEFLEVRGFLQSGNPTTARHQLRIA